MPEAVDLSNWGGELPASVVIKWKATGQVKAIVGVDLGGDHAMLARRQLQTSLAGGLEIDAYRFCYWNSNIESTLRLVASAIAGLPIGRVWLDFEDEDAPLVGYTTQELVCAWIQNCLDVADRIWGRERVGVYTARWWFNPWTGGSTRFSDRTLYVAEYDGDPSLRFTPFGGWTRAAMKQYQGSTSLCGYTVDRNYYEEDEVADSEARTRIAIIEQKTILHSAVDANKMDDLIQYLQFFKVLPQGVTALKKALDGA